MEAANTIEGSNGTGPLAELPASVRALVEKEEATRPRGGTDRPSPERAGWDRAVATGCRHTERFVRTGLARGLAMVSSRKESGAGSQAFGVARFLAAQHAQCPGPCDLDGIGQDIVTAAVAVGVPEAYARRAVANGLATGLGRTA